MGLLKFIFDLFVDDEVEELEPDPPYRPFFNWNTGKWEDAQVAGGIYDPYARNDEDKILPPVPNS